MSAFLCTDTHTMVIATWYGIATGANMVETAHALRRLNNYAVCARYSGDKPVPIIATLAKSVAVVEWLRTHDSADVRAAVRCLDYQCSDGSETAMRVERDLLTQIMFASYVAAPLGVVSKVWDISDPQEPEPEPELADVGAEYDSLIGRLRRAL